MGWFGYWSKNHERRYKVLRVNRDVMYHLIMDYMMDRPLLGEFRLIAKKLESLIPKDVQVVGLMNELEVDCMGFLLYHPSFDSQPNNSELPIIDYDPEWIETNQQKSTEKLVDESILKETLGI